MTECQCHTRVKKRLVAPAQDEPGWRGKIMRGVNALAAKLEAMQPDEAIKFLNSFEHVSDADARDLYENLFKPRGTKTRIIRGVDRLREAQLESLSDRSRDPSIQLVHDIPPVAPEAI